MTQEGGQVKRGVELKFKRVGHWISPPHSKHLLETVACRPSDLSSWHLSPGSFLFMLESRVQGAWNMLIFRSEQGPTKPKNRTNRSSVITVMQNKGFEANRTRKFTRTFGKIIVTQFLCGTFSVPKILLKEVGTVWRTFGERREASEKKIGERGNGRPWDFLRLLFPWWLSQIKTHVVGRRRRPHWHSMLADSMYPWSFERTLSVKTKASYRPVKPLFSFLHVETTMLASVRLRFAHEMVQAVPVSVQQGMARVGKHVKWLVWAPSPPQWISTVLLHTSSHVDMDLRSIAALCFRRIQSNRPLIPILLKSIAIHLPFLLRYFCKSMPSSWQIVVYTPPICITIRLPFLSPYFCRSIRVRGQWNTPKCWRVSLQDAELNFRILPSLCQIEAISSPRHIRNKPWTSSAHPCRALQTLLSLFHGRIRGQCLCLSLSLARLEYRHQFAISISLLWGGQGKSFLRTESSVEVMGELPANRVWRDTWYR